MKNFIIIDNKQKKCAAANKGFGKMAGYKVHLLMIIRIFAGSSLWGVLG